MIKKLISIFLVLLIIITCSSCSLDLFSVETLLSPPSQSGKNGQVQKAFYELTNDKKLQLKTPAYGEHQSSFILYDVNNDNIEEAFVFYSESSLTGSSVRMAYMECVDGEWQIASDIKGAGSGIYDINFVDLNSDGYLEVVVCWSVLDSKTQIAGVYQLTQNKKSDDALVSLGNEYCNAKTFVDFNSDGCKDIVLVYLDDTGTIQKSYMRMFSLSAGHLMKYGETILDSAMSSVSEISRDIVKVGDEKFSRLFIDCVKNERMCFTEVVCWDAERSVPVRQFTEPSLSNQRSIFVNCIDIDNDGLLEVPSITQLYGDEKTFTVKEGDSVYTFTLLKWENVKGDGTSQVATTLFNPLDLYLFSFPWGSNVTIKYDSLRDALVFYEWDEESSKSGAEFFSITHRTEYAQNEILGELLEETDDGVYYYQITDEGYSFGITDELVISSFINI